MIKKSFDDITENKLILLYILSNAEMPLTNSQITEIVMKNVMINYFILHEYLSDLVSAKYIKLYEQDSKQYYLITDKGNETLAFFKNRIPADTREIILRTISVYKKDYKLSTEVISDYIPINENEYLVDCKIIENNTPLIELKLNVGTKAHAKVMCENWRNNSQDIYAKIISAFSGEKQKD